jgi:hypothetical protein
MKTDEITMKLRDIVKTYLPEDVNQKPYKMNNNFMMDFRY